MAKMTKERKNLSIGLLIFTTVIIATAVMGIILLKPSTEYIEGQADVEEYRVSSKVPSRIVKFLVEEGDTVHAGDTLVILDAPDVEAAMASSSALLLRPLCLAIGFSMAGSTSLCAVSAEVTAGTSASGASRPAAV